MSVLAVAIKHLVALGMSGDDLQAAIAEMQAAEDTRSPGAIRQERYRQRGGDSVPGWLRNQIFERDGCCVDCGATDRLEIDHIHPVSRGGGNDESNLQVLCRSCNARKRDRVRKSEKRGQTRTSAEFCGIPTPPPHLDKETSPTPPKEINPTPRVCDPREADPVLPIVDCWNEMASRTGLSRIAKLTTERRKRVRARLAEHTPEAFTEAIAAVERSPFCRGDNTKGWRADFDFLLQPTSFNRLIEGSYDRAASSNRRSTDRQHRGGSNDGFLNALNEMSGYSAADYRH